LDSKAKADISLAATDFGKLRHFGWVNLNEKNKDTFLWFLGILG